MNNKQNTKNNETQKRIYQIRDRESWTIIEEVATEEEAKRIVMEYEEEDKKEERYTPYFYEIVCVDENGDVVNL